MRLSIFHSTSRALREFFLVLVQGYERAPRVSQLPNRYTELIKLLGQEFTLKEASNILNKPQRTLYGWIVSAK